VQNSDQEDKRKQTKMMICHQKKWECEIGGGRKQRQKKNTERQKLPSLQNKKNGEIMKNTTLQDDEHTLKLYKVIDDYAISTIRDQT